MKQTITLSLLFIAVTVLVSCKKTDGPTPVAPALVSRDYSASIKDKTWSGEITYTGKTTEYYSVYFKPDGTLLWSQLSGDYPGHWAIKDKELTMTFNANTVAIKGTLTDDDKLSNISDNTNSYEVNNSALVANPNINLDNTTRVGSVLNSPPYLLLMTFVPGSKFKMKIHDLDYGQIAYTRTASGGSFRFDFNISMIGATKGFGVVTASGGFKGSFYNPGADIRWYLDKP